MPIFKYIKKHPSSHFYCVLTYFLFSTAAQGDTLHRFEITSGSLGGVSLHSLGGSVAFQGNFFGTSIGTGVLIGIPRPTLGYYWQNGVEFVVSPSFNFLGPIRTFEDQPAHGATWTGSILAGVAYNFSEQIENSFFIRAMAGAVFFHVEDEAVADFSWSADIGKRIQITDNISWTPLFSFELISTVPNASLALTLTPIQFSLLF